LRLRICIWGSKLGKGSRILQVLSHLESSWTFGASLFGSIFGVCNLDASILFAHLMLLGFAILKPISRVAPTWLGGGYFGPKARFCASRTRIVLTAMHRKMSVASRPPPQLVLWVSFLRAQSQRVINSVSFPIHRRRTLGA
jgi:hypothetical protein